MNDDSLNSVSKRFSDVRIGETLYVYDYNNKEFEEYRITDIIIDQGIVCYWFYYTEYNKRFWEIPEEYLNKSVYKLPSFAISPSYKILLENV